MGDTRAYTTPASRAAAVGHSRRAEPASAARTQSSRQTAAGPHSGILHLQRTIGNRQTSALVHGALAGESRRADSAIHEAHTAAQTQATRAGAPGLHDADSARASRTNRLLRTLGRGLDLNTRRLAVHTDAEASRVTAGTSFGLASAHRVMLDPARYDARSWRSRELLAHEVAHVAQAKNPEIAGVDRSRAAWLAEVEAGSIARDFAAGRRIDRPLLWRPQGEWTGFSLPDLSSMEQLKRIKLAIASSVRSRVGNRPLAGFIVRSMTRWAEGDLEGLTQDEADLAPEAAPEQSETLREDSTEETASSARATRRQMRRDDPEAFQALRDWERSTMQGQRGLERDIRSEFRSEREGRRRAAGRGRVNAMDVVLALMRAMTGVGAEALHAGPIFPLQLGIRWSGLELDMVADTRLRGIEVSGAIQTSFLGLPVRIGDTAPLPAGARDRPALRRARQATLHFPWLSLDVYGTFPETEVGLFASGSGYITPSHLVYDWFRFTLPSGSVGIPGLAPGLLDTLDWGGEAPQLLVTGVDFRRGGGLTYADIGFVAGPVDLTAFGGLFAVHGLDVSDGDIGDDGALRLELKAAGLNMLRGLVHLSNYSITYDSREGLRIAFGPADLGLLGVESGELGPGMQARLIGGQVDSPLGAFGPTVTFRELVIDSDGSFRVEGLSPATFKGLVEQRLASILTNTREAVGGGGTALRKPMEAPPAAAEDTGGIEAHREAAPPRIQPQPPAEHADPARTRPRLRLPSLRLRRDRLAEDADKVQTLHVVQPAETLSLIARQYYGDVMRFREIAEANGIAAPDYAIEVGQELIIPNAAVQPEAAAAPPPAQPSPEYEAKPERKGLFRDEWLRLSDAARRLRRKRHRDETAGPEPSMEAPSGDTKEESAERAASGPSLTEHAYIIHDAKAYKRDENGAMLPEKSIIPRWTRVTLVETKSIRPEATKTEVILANVSYQEGRRTHTCWTNMTNLYAQFWDPEAHQEEYEEVGKGYAEAMLAVDPGMTQSARIKSGPGVRAVVDQFYPNSTAIADLSSQFQPKISAFLTFLDANGIHASINAGLRHPLRSLVFDSAINAAASEDGLMKAQAQSIKYSLPIDWFHYKDDGTLNVQQSRSMADTARREFGIGTKAARGVKDELGGKFSNHNFGNAVDMHITFDFTVATIVKDNRPYKIKAADETPKKNSEDEWYLANCASKPLSKLADEGFGVTRTQDDDAVHWSGDGT